MKKGPNSKDIKTDSGKFENGVYTTKNGFSGSGLNCPRGGRLYDQTMIPGIFELPNSTEPGERFEQLTQTVAPGVMPYYQISTYGKIINKYSGKLMKPNYRPNGYEYYCLAAQDDNNNVCQKKYTTHRMVMKTFYPVDNQDELTVNHIDLIKSHNYVDKVMKDGSVVSNLEWATYKENIDHADAHGARPKRKLDMNKANDIRYLHDQGYSYEQIRLRYNYVSMVTIKNVCKNLIYKDPDYIPKTYADSYLKNPANLHRLTDRDADIIRRLSLNGFSNSEIVEKFYPEFSKSTISDIVRGVTHNPKDNSKLELK